MHIWATLNCWGCGVEHRVNCWRSSGHFRCDFYFAILIGSHSLWRTIWHVSFFSASSHVKPHLNLFLLSIIGKDVKQWPKVWNRVPLLYKYATWARQCRESETCTKHKPWPWTPGRWKPAQRLRSTPTQDSDSCTEIVEQRETKVRQKDLILPMCLYTSRCSPRS